MRWPWQRAEKRDSSYEGALVGLLRERAEGTSAGDPSALASLEACAGLWSRAFGAARLEPDIPAVTPAILAMIGRDLIRHGDSLFILDMMAGRPVLETLRIMGRARRRRRTRVDVSDEPLRPDA